MSRPGSNGPAPFEKWEIPNVLLSRICPLPMVTDESRVMLRMYTHYKNNILVFAGGILDQPSPYITAMEVIDNYIGSLNAKTTS